MNLPHRKIPQDLAKWMRQFDRSIQDYKKADCGSTKQLAKEKMEAFFTKIEGTCPELNKEQRTLESRLAKDFQVFLEFPTENNSNVVQQDLIAFKESLLP
ncbi:MAG: hypothetical protein AAGI90_00885 [Chlamydiota bacterium]